MSRAPSLSELIAQAGDCLARANMHAKRAGGHGYAAHYIAEARELYEVALDRMRRGERVADAEPAQVSQRKSSGNGGQGAKLDPPKPVKPSSGLAVADFLSVFQGARA